MKCGDVLSDGLNLRPVNFDDRKILFEWRNDSLTRKNSLHTETVDWEKHCQWFEGILATNRLLFILEDKYCPVGQIRIDIEDGMGTVNYSIAPDKRGLGYGKIILQLCENYLYEQQPSISLRGIVKKDNIASQKIFLSLNYTEKENDNYFVYKKTVLSYHKLKNMISGGG